MDLVHRLAAGTTWIDLQFLGRPHRIASGLLHGSAGAAIIDPGPTTCLPALERALAALGTPLDAVTHLVLTHIHLDHAGAAGVIVERHPHIRVVVHRRGAPHLVDPTRLLDCFERIALTRAEYESVRQHATRFFVRPGHEDLQVELVIESYPTFVVVEKDGAAAEVALDTDPRAGQD